MSNNFVTLILKTVIDKSQLLDFEYFASLVLEHSSLDSRLYGQALKSLASFSGNQKKAIKLHMGEAFFLTRHIKFMYFCTVK